MMKCSFCNNELKKGEEAVVIGKTRGSFIAGWVTSAGGDPLSLFEKERKIYCKSCFNKQFKKK